MHIMVSPSTSFETACRQLKAKKRLRFIDAVDWLRSLSDIAYLAKILQELNPTVYANVIDGGIRLDSIFDDELDKVGIAVLDEISDLFPINECCYEHMSEGEMTLHIDQLGPAYSWDEWYEVLSCPEDIADYEELFFLARLLTEGVMATPIQGDDFSWASLANRFDWPAELPNLDGKLDRQLFFSRLDDAGLECFKTVFEIAWYDTGNFFYDYNIYDDLETPDFTIENIKKLAEDYKKTPQITGEFSRAIDMAEADPAVKARVIEIFASSLVKEETEKNRTLVDLWTAGMLEETQQNLNDLLPVEEDYGRPIYDPFYGRIG